MHPFKYGEKNMKINVSESENEEERKEKEDRIYSTHKEKYIKQQKRITKKEKDIVHMCYISIQMICNERAQ